MVSSRSLFFEELESRLALSADPAGLLGPGFHDGPRSDDGPGRAHAARHVGRFDDAIRVVTTAASPPTTDVNLVPTLRLGETTPASEASRRTPARPETTDRAAVTRTDRLADASPALGSSRSGEKPAVGWNPDRSGGFAGLLALATFRVEPADLVEDEVEPEAEAAPERDAPADRDAYFVVASRPVAVAEAQPTEDDASDARFVVAVPAVPADAVPLAGPALSPEALAVSPLTRQLFEQLRQDMLRQMREVLTDAQFKEFARALTQPADPAGNGDGATPEPTEGK